MIEPPKTYPHHIFLGEAASSLTKLMFPPRRGTFFAVGCVFWVWFWLVAAKYVLYVVILQVLVVAQVLWLPLAYSADGLHALGLRHRDRHPPPVNISIGAVREPRKHGPAWLRRWWAEQLRKS
jgi:hypothetical protein